MPTAPPARAGAEGAPPAPPSRTDVSLALPPESRQPLRQEPKEHDREDQQRDLPEECGAPDADLARRRRAVSPRPDLEEREARDQRLDETEHGGRGQRAQEDDGATHHHRDERTCDVE